ncbi:hypothetical protein WBG78_22125 [Chryseolinea sp. T2]|uniref:hypothetical protein n=1 Tax=Chryseolinea sp. T2 TaxID=3129255 RepID=UPI0030788D89
MSSQRLLSMFFLLAIATAGYAQTTKPAFTDDDLKKYAITMDSVKDMQENLNESITEMVQKTTIMEVPRYNELFKVINDSTKLVAANAKPEEVAFVKEVAKKRADESAKITATFQSLAKDYVGLKAFNAIKKSLATDTAVKEKYDALAKELDAKS